MEPYGLSMNRLAMDLHVPVTWIAEIVNEGRGITSDTHGVAAGPLFQDHAAILDEYATALRTAGCQR